jgi:acyl-[acyl-carrier-protein]-phospholipid O-acyltransferase/long-chain-fatty-acid--[acyl-carrier-protein] ligase
MALSLLRTSRFLPLFLTQALGALNDNLFKNALVVLVLFHDVAGAPMLVAASGGVFILPYALFSATAGQLADRFDKSRLIQLTKLFEIALMLLAGWGLLADSVQILMGVLFGLGIHAAFFGPLKYGVLPDHLAEQELVDGNALIEAGTFAGILMGTIAGGMLILANGGAWIVTVACLAVALGGTAAAFRIPRAAPGAPNLRIEWNIVRETMLLVRQAAADHAIWLSILGLSWFWCFGAILLAEFPVIAKETLQADSTVITLFLTMFAIGVGSGSMLNGWLLDGEISPRYVPFAALGLSIFTFDFARACAVSGSEMQSVAAILAHPAGWRALFDLVMLSMCGGLYSVPLYAIVQEESAPACRSRMIAANNVMNALYMVGGALGSAILAGLGLSAPFILAVAASVNLLIAVYIVKSLPRETMRGAFRWYFQSFHGVDVVGVEQYRQVTGPKVLIINHLSLLDGCFVASFLPGDVTFAVNTHIAQTWWARPFLSFVEIYTVDPGNPYALKSMIRTVQDGTTLGVFPEGRLSRTGALMKIYEGAGMVADRADAVLIPVRIDGLQFTRLSGLQGKVRARWFPRITMTILPPVRLDVPASLQGRARRQAVGTQLQTLMIESAFATAPIDRTLFTAFLDSASRFGRSTLIAEDIERRPLSYRKLTLGAVVLGRVLAARSSPGERIGMLLPNANATLVTLLGLWAFGRVPMPLNVTSGADALLSGCTAADVRCIVSSRRFVERASLEPLVARLSVTHKIIWLEDLRAALRPWHRLRGLIDALLVRRLPGSVGDPDSLAVVLSTSGSEGAPKAVLLSHRNLVANCAQLAAVIDFTPADRVLNAMPVFHAFGLTGGTILPMLYGVRTFFYPSPLHYKIVPELIYDTDATILFGTDTFLNGWARFAHPYDFYAVRYIFAGAEKLREETRQLYAEQFGVRLLEGYGATETGPVLAVNTPMRRRHGSVGRFLPGIKWRLEPVPGIASGGRLLVSGPNVMLGYWRATAPGVTELPEDGWYDTGDIVEVDEDGFVTIIGRVKRFAKIGGEMVSMGAAEDLAASIWPDFAHAVVMLPDPRKGEQLLLVTTAHEASVPMLLSRARERSMPEIAVPRRIVSIDSMPVLATGKVDYPAVECWLTTELLTQSALPTA